MNPHFEAHLGPSSFIEVISKQKYIVQVPPVNLVVHNQFNLSF